MSEQAVKLCAECGTPMPGVPQCRKFCSVECYDVSRGVWDRDAIVCAMQEWAAQYGQAPRIHDWAPSQAPEEQRAERWQRRGPAGSWPSHMTVINHWGTWNAALVAAGLEVNRTVSQAWRHV